MMPASLILLKWMLACGGCLVAGLLLRATLSGAVRIWPALLARRAVWIAAHGVIAASALLPFLPYVPLKLMPSVTLHAPMPMPVPAPDVAQRTAPPQPPAAQPLAGPITMASHNETTAASTATTAVV